MQWSGLLSPGFVQSVIDTVLCVSSFRAVLLRIRLINVHRLSLKEMKDDASSGSFVSVTSHALSESPLSYISPTVLVAGAKASLDSLPVRVPRSDGEDTWCALLAPANGGISWAMVESLGQWDTRWG